MTTGPASARARRSARAPCTLAAGDGTADVGRGFENVAKANERSPAAIEAHLWAIFDVTRDAITEAEDVGRGAADEVGRRRHASERPCLWRMTPSPGLCLKTPRERRLLRQRAGF